MLTNPSWYRELTPGTSPSAVRLLCSIASVLPLVLYGGLLCGISQSPPPGPSPRAFVVGDRLNCGEFGRLNPALTEKHGWLDCSRLSREHAQQLAHPGKKSDELNALLKPLFVHSYAAIVLDEQFPERAGTQSFRGDDNRVYAILFINPKMDSDSIAHEMFHWENRHTALWVDDPVLHKITDVSLDILFVHPGMALGASALWIVPLVLLIIAGSANVLIWRSPRG